MATLSRARKPRTTSASILLSQALPFVQMIAGRRPLAEDSRLAAGQVADLIEAQLNAESTAGAPGRIYIPLDTETKAAIATLAAEFALGEVTEPSRVKTEGAQERWGDMGLINESLTDKGVAEAVRRAKDMAATADVREGDTVESLKVRLLGW